MQTLRNILRVLLGLAMLYAGIGHLSFRMEAFYAQVPRWITTDLGFMQFIVISSGLVEIAFGIFMIIGGKFKIKTGLLLALFYVLIFPGNINQYVEGIDSFGLNTDQQRLNRLFFQPLLVAWAIWSTNSWNHFKTVVVPKIKGLLGGKNKA